MADDDVETLVDLVRRGALTPDAAESQLRGEPTKVASLRSALSAINLSQSVFFGDTVADREFVADIDPEALPTSNRLTLGDRLGRGGMGEVWLAHDPVLRRHVAVKTLRPHVDDDETRRRFVYEAQATARLTHPGVIPVYDAGRLTDGRLFYAMQRIAGESLGEVLDSLRRGDPAAEARWPLPKLLEVFVRVCQTVSYAHDQGFVHRDLKPENVMLGEYGEVFVADWGLVKPFDVDGVGASDLPRHDKTRPGAAVGTLAYMSPEQVLGDLKAIGPHSDVYSLGVILFELLTLELPFKGPSAVALSFKIVRGPPVDPRSVPCTRVVPEPLAEVCRLAMLRDAGDRTPTAGRVAMRVEAFLHGVEERRRRGRMAEETLARARELEARYQDEAARIERERVEVVTALGGLPPTTPVASRMPLWRTAQAVEERALELEGVFARAVGAAYQSLAYVDTGAAHAVLADLHHLRYLRARATGNALDARYFLDEVRRHDQGRYASLHEATGGLEVRSPGVVMVEVQDPVGPLLSPREIKLPENGQVPQGSYLLHFEPEGRIPAHIPAVVERGLPTVVEVIPPAPFEGHEAWIYVAGGGAVVVGGDAAAHRGRPRQVVEVRPFLISRDLVTLEDYVAFLNALAASDGLDAAKAHAPRTPGRIWLDIVADRFQVPERDPDGDRWDPRWPAHMLSWHDATAFCRWRSRLTGVAHRLPTEDEWEHAARGADARTHPWGNGFDPALCRMVDSAEGKAGPVPVGSYPYDTSPYGVRDMGGLVFEWTGTQDPADPTRYLLKGGAYRSVSAYCRAASRISQPPDRVGLQCGFRVVRAAI